MPILKRKNDFAKIIFLSFGINLLLLIISVVSILLYYPTSISPELIKLDSFNTVFLVTRRIQLTSFLSQTDSIFIFFWSFAILEYILILLNGIIYILNKLFSYENKNKLSIPIISIIIGSVFSINKIMQLEYLEKDILKYFSIIITFCIPPIILFFGYLKKGVNNATHKK